MAPGPRSATRGGMVAVMVLVLAALAVVAACTGGGSQPEPPPSQPVALSVETVSGAEGIDEPTRTAMETAIGDVLSTYVAEAFLGDFPRREFVPAFEAFTSGAARHAAQDIDRLTASRVQEATAMRATRLDARLSFLVNDRRALGATAVVHFAFEATMEDGATQPVTLQGRFMLEGDAGEWLVFGYDVALDDG
ncbi:hypothetical protein, partial [Nocardioides sp.]|uniref:hypothetical protein n=1 Tax=Nocardioides sp. TaxID=35761 RepID=UPI00286D9575